MVFKNDEEAGFEAGAIKQVPSIGFKYRVIIFV
jgi:hypothetical protein